MKVCNGNYEEWDEYLAAAVFCYRITPIERLGKSPFQLIYGRTPKLMGDTEAENVENTKEKPKELEIFKGLDEMRKGCQKAAVDIRNREKEKLESRRKYSASKYSIGDLVMKIRRPFEKNCKLDEKWSGPFRVTRVFENGGLEIQDLFGALFKYNQKDIQRMEGTDPETWEIDKKGGVLTDDDTCLVMHARQQDY